MSRCFICNNILSDEDQRLIYRLECDLARKGKMLDNHDEICSFCRYTNVLNIPESVDIDTVLGYNVLANDDFE